MNKDYGYKNKTYKDAGVKRRFTAKVMTVILALLLASPLTVTSCESSAEANTTGSAAAAESAEAADNAVSKSEMFTDRDLPATMPRARQRLSLSAEVLQKHRRRPASR